MALGIPVVAGNPLAAEAVIDGVTGVHVSPITAATLTAPLRGLLGNHVARRAMGSAGRDRVASRYSWGRIATETLRYQAVPASSSAPAKCRSG
jgi:glycosyltransferase involved in cell wall biosynthesis